jgi:hypothetical protein
MCTQRWRLGGIGGGARSSFFRRARGEASLLRARLPPWWRATQRQTAPEPSRPPPPKKLPPGGMIGCCPTTPLPGSSGMKPAAGWAGWDAGQGVEGGTRERLERGVDGVGFVGARRPDCRTRHAWLWRQLPRRAHPNTSNPLMQRVAGNAAETARTALPPLAASPCTNPPTHPPSAPVASTMSQPRPSTCMVESRRLVTRTRYVNACPVPPGGSGSLPVQREVTSTWFQSRFSLGGGLVTDGLVMHACEAEAVQTAAAPTAGAPGGCAVWPAPCRAGVAKAGGEEPRRGGGMPRALRPAPPAHLHALLRAAAAAPLQVELLRQRPQRRKALRGAARGLEGRRAPVRCARRAVSCCCVASQGPTELQRRGVGHDWGCARLGRLRGRPPLAAAPPRRPGQTWSSVV